jgi:hypothetical protein
MQSLDFQQHQVDINRKELVQQILQIVMLLYQNVQQHEHFTRQSKG